MKQGIRTIGQGLLQHIAVLPVIPRLLQLLIRLGYIPGNVWKRIPVDKAFRVTLQKQSYFMYRSLPGDGIGRALFWQGIDGWEVETIKVFSHYVTSSSLILDIGSNTGIYSLLACALNPDARIHAFEPVPDTWDQLAENIKLNNWQNRCTVYNLAASNYDGTASFHIPEGQAPTSASLNTLGFRNIKGELIEVSVTMLDTILLHQDIDLVKIDVEGFEDHVLEGMVNILEKSQPIIIIECNTDGPYREIEAILNGYHYRYFHIRSKLTPMEHIEPDTTERYRNYLCLPSGKSDMKSDI